MTPTLPPRWNRKWLCAWCGQKVESWNPHLRLMINPDIVYHMDCWKPSQVAERLTK